MKKFPQSTMIVLMLCFASVVMAEYDEAKFYPTRPPPKILSHKQAQNHDGGFKFHFASENGLAQTEFIAPDGSRNGGYSYVDPHGKTVSVKYTAGKEGFRILEGEHIPREPILDKIPQRRLENPPESEPIVQPQYIPQPSLPKYVLRPQYIQQRQYEEAPATNNVEEADNPKEPEYNDEPGKPYSFGTGYAFHIAA